jgi:hypothetical protein
MKEVTFFAYDPDNDVYDYVERDDRKRIFLNLLNSLEQFQFSVENPTLSYNNKKAKVYVIHIAEKFDYLKVLSLWLAVPVCLFMFIGFNLALIPGIVFISIGCAWYLDLYRRYKNLYEIIKEASFDRREVGKFENGHVYKFYNFKTKEYEPMMLVSRNVYDELMIPYFSMNWMPLLNPDEIIEFGSWKKEFVG